MKSTRKMFLLMLLGASAPAAVVAQTPLDTGIMILSPRFFPGWQAQHVSYPFVVRADGASRGYRMYYAGSSSTQVNESLWDQWVTGVVTSSDGVNWQYPDTYEPILFARKFMEGDVVNPDEQAKIFDSVYAIDAFVLKDGPLYKCWYTGWNGDIRSKADGVADKINFRIGYATSADGLNWTKLKGDAGAGSVLGPGVKDASDEFGVEDPYILKENGLYRMWYVGYDGRRKRIHQAVSRDGLTWTKMGVVQFDGGKAEPAQLNASNPVVIKRADQYEIWYEEKDNSRPNQHLIRALSRDAKSWKKSGVIRLHPTTPEPSWPWSSIAPEANDKTIIGNIIVLPDNSCQIFYAQEFTAGREVTYGHLSAQLSYIFTERVNP